MQPSQVSLGNRALFDWLSRTAEPDLTVRVRGVAMVAVYGIDAAGDSVRSRFNDSGEQVAASVCRLASRL